VTLHLLDDHISALAKKLPSLYRRRTLVLLCFLALHLFIVTPFVRLSTDEQRYRDEAVSIATRTKHLQAVETDISRALGQVDRQKALLLDDLVARFKELNAARDDFRAPMEHRFGETPFQSTGPFPGAAGQPEAGQALAEAVAKAENADEPIAAYRDLIQHQILEPAFTQANQRWQDEKTGIAAGLRRIRNGLPADERLQQVRGLLTKIDDEVRLYRFTSPEGDWWMTVSGKEAVLDRNLDRITGTLQEAITPLAAGRDKLNREIVDIKARLAETQREKEELAQRAAESFHQIEHSLNIAVIDGVQVVTFFPALLAAALGLMTADIGLCLQQWVRSKRQADSDLRKEMVQWLTIATRPPWLLHFIMAFWIFLAALQLRPVNPDNTRYAGQILFAAAVLATAAVWEGFTRRRGLADGAVREGAQTAEGSSSTTRSA